MAGATRLSFFHFCHGNGTIVFSNNVIHGIMAGRAIVVEIL